jgi:short subunit fatty acids transporter
MWLATPPLGRARRRGPRHRSGTEPRRHETRTAVATAPTPGQWLEHSPLLTWLIVAIGGAYLVRYFMQAGDR